MSKRTIQSYFNKGGKNTNAPLQQEATLRKNVEDSVLSQSQEPDWNKLSTQTNGILANLKKIYIYTYNL